MRKRVLLFLATAALMVLPQQMKADNIVINETNFPDENFRNWILSQDYGQDGVLTEEEINSVKSMFIDPQNIADLKGIEFFPALSILSCGINKLTSLDVSKNVALTTLYCSSNQLTSLDVSNSTALSYFDCSGNQLTSLNVSNNTALSYFDCSGNQLTSLDVSKNVALTTLYCSNNQLTSLDVSNNTALSILVCYENQLTSLDVSNNTLLERFYCYENQITAIDVTNNAALRYLYCNNNQLTELDVSKNTELRYLGCENNQLTSLDVSNTLVFALYCHGNKIKGNAMDALIESMKEQQEEIISFTMFYAFNPYNDKEQNVLTKNQVAAVKEKNWRIMYYNPEIGEFVEYEGSDPEDIAPVDEGQTINIGTEIDENTDLDGNVVGDIFYSISSGDGSYDPAEGCIIVNKPTDDSAIDGKDIFGEDFKAGYTGIVFKVNEGKGSIKVEAETQGNMVLKVKIGNGDPIEMELDGKLKVKFPYNVSEETLVYIYGGMNSDRAKATGASRAKQNTDLLKIYGFEIVSEASGIETIENGQSADADAPVYNLNGQRVNTPAKGVYIKNGRKVIMK